MTVSPACFFLLCYNFDFVSSTTRCLCGKKKKEIKMSKSKRGEFVLCMFFFIINVCVVYGDIEGLDMIFCLFLLWDGTCRLW